jgi:hypothetical protein
MSEEGGGTTTLCKAPSTILSVSIYVSTPNPKILDPVVLKIPLTLTTLEKIPKIWQLQIPLTIL